MQAQPAQEAVAPSRPVAAGNTQGGTLRAPAVLQPAGRQRALGAACSGSQCAGAGPKDSPAGARWERQAASWGAEECHGREPGWQHT